MSETSNDDNADTPSIADVLMDDDDKTVTTETTTAKTDFIGQELTEHTIRFEIPFNQGDENKDAFQLHAKLLAVISKSVDKTDLRIINNKNKRVQAFDEPKWMDKTYHKSHFTVHVDSKQQRTIICHRIRSKKGIPGIKGESSVINFLKNTKTFLRAHFWKEDEVLLRDIGFLSRYVPTQHSKAFVLQDMSERMDFCEVAEFEAPPTAPPFKLIHSQPRLRLKSNKTLKTHAYAIQVMTKDTAKMNHYLRKVYATEPLYIPYSSKRNHPEVAAKAILSQNKQMSETYVIVVVGVHRDVMSVLIPQFSEIPGYIETSDTNRTDQTGRWQIIVRETHFKRVRKLIGTHLQHWISAVSQSRRDSTPTHFPVPQVHQRYGNHDDEDSSAGHASYMSSCSQSYGSFDETDATYAPYFAPPNSTTNRSYASVTRTPTAPMATTAVSTASEESQEIQDIKQDFLAVIKGLQSEITSLRLQVGQVGQQTPSTVTEASATDTQTSRLDKVDTSIVEIKEWMQEIATIMRGKTEENETQGSKHAQAEDTAPRNPSKKANTQHTPDRLPRPPLYIENGPGNFNHGGRGTPATNLNPYSAHPPQHQPEYPGYPYAMHPHMQPNIQSPPRYHTQPHQYNNNYPPFPNQQPMQTQPMQDSDSAIGSPSRLLAEGANTHRV